MPEKDTDAAYHEYLWGEPSPRSFAQKAKVGGTKKRISRYDFVPR